MKKRIVTVIGARPQFVKAATLSRALKNNNNISEEIIHTGQHYDHQMSQVFFDELEIPAPLHNLHVGSGNHGAMTGNMLSGIENILLDNRPDAMLVYGDTNSTLAGALAATKLHIPVIHVEAGLRSFNRNMPEEINRILTDHVSSILFAPTQTAIKNLTNEGIIEGVHSIGDVSFDATLFAIEKAKRESKIVEEMGLIGEDFALCTLHRAENTDDDIRFKSILDFIISEAQKRKIVFPVHPRIRAKLTQLNFENKNIIQIEPVGYFDMHALMAEASLVISDSGGLQKEAYFHSKPCITLRDETEWVETIEAGWNRLWNVEGFKQPRTEISDYGNGNAANKIVDILTDFLC